MSTSRVSIVARGMASVSTASVRPWIGQGTARQIHLRHPNLAASNGLGRAVTVRSASTDTVSMSTAPGPASQAQPLSGMTWNVFLALRKSRRKYGLFSSVATVAGSVAFAVPVIASQELDTQVAAMLGMDPFIAVGLLITSVGGMAWLIGPALGNSLFKVIHRNVREQITRKEGDFYRHITRHRADPSSSTVNNPIPDYYGEKIGSVADYRRWLKDQRAFTRKTNKFLI